MIYAYGVSLPGTYHIKNGIVCQDYHQIIHCADDIAVAVVADGLGSAVYSDVGSKLATTVSAEHCRQNIVQEAVAEQILETIKAAFGIAKKTVEDEAAKNGHSVEQYDTTLTLAVLIRNTLYYGHSGDSGIVALTTQGRYEQVTKQQRDDDGRVYPLFFNDKWEFEEYKTKVSGVFLATDGMLETLFPIYIKNEPVNIHVSLAQFFMDNRILRINKLGQEAVQSHISDFLENLPDEKVSDDKTVVVLINTAIKTKRQPKNYYEEPDWAELKQKYDDEWKRKFYPGLFETAPHEPQSNSGKSTISAPKPLKWLLGIFRRREGSKP